MTVKWMMALQCYKCTFSLHERLICLLNQNPPLKTNIALERKHAKTVSALAAELNIAHLPNLLQQFLFEQQHPDDPQNVSELPEFHFHGYNGRISVFNSASSRFYSPSDLSRIGGMRTEYIRACPQW